MKMKKMKAAVWYTEQAEQYLEAAAHEVVVERAAVQAQAAHTSATLALVAVVNRMVEALVFERVAKADEMTGSRSQVIATTGGRIEGVNQSVG